MSATAINKDIGLGENLLRYKKNQRYLIFDFETCHLNLLSEKNKPWQLGYIIAEGDKIIDRQNIYIKWPKLEIAKEIAEKIHYDPRIIAEEGIDPKEALDKFEKYLYDPQYRVVMYNGLNFDIYIHSIWRRSLGLKHDYSYIDRIIDCYALAKANKGKIKFSSKNFLLWQYSVLDGYLPKLKAKLEVIANDFGLNPDTTRTHDATYDIELTYGVLQKLLWTFEII